MNEMNSRRQHSSNGHSIVARDSWGQDEVAEVMCSKNRAMTVDPAVQSTKTNRRKYRRRWKHMKSSVICSEFRPRVQLMQMFSDWLLDFVPQPKFAQVISGKQLKHWDLGRKCHRFIRHHRW